MIFAVILMVLGPLKPLFSLVINTGVVSMFSLTNFCLDFFLSILSFCFECSITIKMFFMFVIIYLCITCSFSNIFHSVKMLNAKIYMYEQCICKSNKITTYTHYIQCTIRHKNHHATGTGYTDMVYYRPVNNPLIHIIHVLWQI